MRLVTATVLLSLRVLSSSLGDQHIYNIYVYILYVGLLYCYSTNVKAVHRSNFGRQRCAVIMPYSSTHDVGLLSILQYCCSKNERYRRWAHGGKYFFRAYTNDEVALHRPVGTGAEHAGNIDDLYHTIDPFFKYPISSTLTPSPPPYAFSIYVSTARVWPTKALIIALLVRLTVNFKRHFPASTFRTARGAGCQASTAP